ncbi:hypothetical protein D3C80_835740 [compost metagenome]
MGELKVIQEHIRGGDIFPDPGSDPGQGLAIGRGGRVIELVIVVEQIEEERAAQPVVFCHVPVGIGIQPDLIHVKAL